jgi:hypothetical protein
MFVGPIKEGGPLRTVHSWIVAGFLKVCILPFHWNQEYIINTVIFLP